MNNGDHEEGLTFACAYTMDVMPFDFLEKAFFRRTGEIDELLISTAVVGGGDRMDEQLTAPVAGSELSACLQLLRRRIRSGLGFQWPGRFVAAGIVDEHAFVKMRLEVEEEIDRIRERARDQETEIIRTARECGLHPEPSGTAPHAWRATCPGTQHPIYLNAASNSFGCGWCKRRGSSAELRRFVEERL